MPEAYLVKERRIYPRISVKVPISYSVVEGERNIQDALEERRKVKNGHTLDLSLGGLCVLSGEPLLEGWVLELEIAILPLDTSLRATAEVVWANETGGGVRFLKMKEEDMKTLKAYLDKASQR